MASDPRKLRPFQILRLINTSPLGEVISHQQLDKHRISAGFRICDDEKTINLFKYAAWMITVLNNRKPRDEVAEYEQVKERARQRASDIAKSGRDIGEIPEVVNPERKARASVDFRFFAESYFPQLFSLDWSEDHLRVISQIEESVLRGGLFATAMPRGSGKTTLCEVASIWAVCNGHREFVCLIASDADRAEQMLDSIKTELEVNNLLMEDYPEVLYPIWALEGIANRANGQLYKGERTHITWNDKEIVLPIIPGSKGSAAIVKVAGLTGSIRGMKYKRHDGRAVRPSLVVIDDPQTDESARSPSQCDTRERILAGAVVGLAGIGKKISGIMPCTVIRGGDMADNILSREKHPEWNGVRTKMMYSFPLDEKLWQKYADIRAESLQQDRQGVEATEFYVKNREAMDQGARAAWAVRFNHDEISAVQHAMNIKITDERAFWAEYQNEPMPDQDPRKDDLTADQIANKLNNMQRGLIPDQCQHLTMFIDVQASLLYYMVCAWDEEFTGFIVDYGSYPDQKRPYFTLRDATNTLRSQKKGVGLEGSIWAGLQALTEKRLGMEWQKESGGIMRVERCLVDCGWGETTDLIKKFCRQSPFAQVLIPSEGVFVGAQSSPMRDWPKRQGDRVGHNWKVPNVIGRAPVKKVLFDTNYWKSFILARLSVSMGDRGCLSLWGDKASTHRCFADHCLAEYRVRTEGRGRVVDAWKGHPGRDNHWWDGIVGCAVAGSMQGAMLREVQEVKGPKKPKVRFSDLQRQKRQQQI